MCMSTKTISISKEAYERLKSVKKDSESFTDVINRMTGRVKLSDFAGLLSEKEAKDLEAAIIRMRSKSRDRVNRIRKELA